MVGRAGQHYNSSSWVYNEAVCDRTVGVRELFELLFSPANKIGNRGAIHLWRLFAPLCPMYTLLPVSDVSACVLLGLCLSCYSVTPGSIQKIPYYWHSPCFHCFRQGLGFAPQIMPSVLLSFGLTTLRSGAVSTLSRHLPV